MAIFEASPEGFRQLNLSRPPAHLVREAIQNVFDEAATVCDVQLHHTPKQGVYLRVADDVPGGIRDEKLVFTIWLSDKQDSPTKRGRMGRGLKELISVCDWARIRTTGRPGIVFDRDAKTAAWTRGTRVHETVDTGTTFEAEVSEWNKADVKDIQAYLSRINPPEGLTFRVNGQVIPTRRPTEAYNLTLATVVMEEGRERMPYRETKVSLFAEPEPMVYEMGLPIEPIQFPLSIDIAQRVPLREKRDTLLDFYRRELFAGLLNARITIIPPEQLKDQFVIEAASTGWALTAETKRLLAEAWTEGRPFAATPQMASVATGQHVSVVNLRSLPEAIRDLVKEVGTDVKTVLEARRGEFCPIVQTLAPAEQHLIDSWMALVRGIGYAVSVAVRDGHPGALADFDQDAHVVSVYREEIPMWSVWCADPYTVEPLATLIHELAHWTRREQSHGFDFHSDAEEVGAKAARWLYNLGRSRS